MKNGWITLLFASFALVGHSINDPAWPAYITASYSELPTECDSFGPGYGSITIDMVTNTYEKRQKFCGDALIHWEAGVVERGFLLKKIVDKVAVANPGDEPEWNDVAPTVSGSFFLEGEVLVEYSSLGEEVLRYYLGFSDETSWPICLMPHDRGIIL